MDKGENSAENGQQSRNFGALCDSSSEQLTKLADSAIVMIPSDGRF
jgi:hypothetical protein